MGSWTQEAKVKPVGWENMCCKSVCKQLEHCPVLHSKSHLIIAFRSIVVTYFDICILAILDGIVNVMQHLLNAADKNGNLLVTTSNLGWSCCRGAINSAVKPGEEMTYSAYLQFPACVGSDMGLNAMWGGVTSHHLRHQEE